MNQASCVIVIDDGKILCASRRGTLDDWGLIGGKQDANETAEECGRREFLEETGVDLIGKLQFLWSMTDDHGYLCSIFMVNNIVDLIRCRHEFSKRKYVENFAVDFVEPYELLRSQSFYKFNSKIVGLMMTDFINRRVESVEFKSNKDDGAPVWPT